MVVEDGGGQCITVKRLGRPRCDERCAEEGTSESEPGLGKQVGSGLLEELPFELILREG